MSEAQLAANRANAREDGMVRPYPRNGKAPETASGQGPKTEEGKQKARLNAMRHGLTGQTVIQTVEDSIAHRDFMLPIIQKLAPKGALEIQYAQLIAQDHYRLNRIAAAEQSHLALSLSRDDIGVRNSNFVETDVAYSHSNSFHRDAKTIQLLSLYESRINRNLKKNMEQLAQLQATRKAEEAQAIEEAELLAELAEYEGWTFDPAEFGFVFSKEIFEKRITRKRLLDNARTLRTTQNAGPNGRLTLSYLCPSCPSVAALASFFRSLTNPGQNRTPQLRRPPRNARYNRTKCPPA